MTDTSVIEPTRAALPYELVTNQIVQLLEQGTVPWRQPWRNNGMPASMSTSKPYRGVNVFLLNMASTLGAYNNRHFGTYRQVAALGGQVRKGERSHTIVFWKRDTKVVVDDAGDEQRKSWAMLRYFRVFNADQADWPDGLPERFAPPPLTDHDPIVDAQRIFDEYIERDGAPTFRMGGDHAYYSPADDLVNVPLLGRFTSPAAFYSACFHESTHSTGHRKRLAREGVLAPHSMQTAPYAREELIAEMGAAMLCAVAGIEQDTLEASAAYLDHWLSALKGDQKLIVSAAGAAQRAVDHILGTDFDEGAA